LTVEQRANDGSTEIEDHDIDTSQGRQKNQKEKRHKMSEKKGRKE
jgi:hypothetical protein